MQLRGNTTSSNATYRQGIIEEIDRLCDTDETSYPRADKTSRINNALEEVVAWILQADGRWQFDDTNYTTHPRGLGTLVNGQEDYSFTAEYLDVEAIEILDTRTPNMYIRIKQLDHSMLNGLSPQEYFGLDSDGTPRQAWPEYYDINGDTIRLYPAPDSGSVTLTNGIRVWFKRTASLFTVTTGTGEDTTQPGFASPYHAVLAYMAAIPYNEIYHPERVARQQFKVNEMKKAIQEFYGHRNFDERKTMTMLEETAL